MEISVTVPDSRPFVEEFRVAIACKAVTMPFNRNLLEEELRISLSRFVGSCRFSTDAAQAAYAFFEATAQALRFLKPNENVDGEAAVMLGSSVKAAYNAMPGARPERSVARVRELLGDWAAEAARDGKEDWPLKIAFASAAVVEGAGAGAW